MIELEILGPLVVRADGEQVRLGPALRTLLLGLLCARGDLVPAPRLATLVLETGAAQGSPATLRSHVSHLRRALGEVAGADPDAPPLVTDQLGGSAAYALRVDPGRVDATRFERLTTLGSRELHLGRFENAAETLREGLSLWRGQPLADVADRAFARPEIRRLESSYRAAVIARVQADAECGLHRAVIGELEAMADRWPGDESVLSLLAVCLYRSGRAGEAAQVCRDAIAAAHDQGLDSRRLADLQRDVLRGSLERPGQLTPRSAGLAHPHTPLCSQESGTSSS